MLKEPLCRVRPSVKFPETAQIPRGYAQLHLEGGIEKQQRNTFCFGRLLRPIQWKPIEEELTTGRVSFLESTTIMYLSGSGTAIMYLLSFWNGQTAQWSKQTQGTWTHYVKDEVTEY
jgi:hypothetical protein